MARPFLAPIATVLTILLALPARATVLVPADLAELSRGAAIIVRGTVTAVTPEWAEGRRRIETVVTVAVDQTLKGDSAGNVSFKVPGGDMGRYRSIMIGAPSFRPGEEVILFLGGRAPALPYLLGLGQGVYRVQRDARTGQAQVISPALVGEPGQPTLVRRGDPARRPLSLAEFVTQVRDAMASGGRDRRSTTTIPGGKRDR